MSRYRVRTAWGYLSDLQKACDSWAASEAPRTTRPLFRVSSTKGGPRDRSAAIAPIDDRRRGVRGGWEASCGSLVVVVEAASGCAAVGSPVPLDVLLSKNLFAKFSALH